jgi:TIR domain-containing protein
MTDDPIAIQPTPPRRGTVFISYARADDEQPPYDDTAKGWVTFFWNQLRWELTDRGATQAKLWLDRYQIEPAEAFTPKIEGAVKDAVLILPVFSENWVQSDWCQREVEMFVRAHEDAGGRIVPVFKNEPPRSLLPDVMQGEQAREGYRFFALDERGAVHEFYWRGLQNRTAYFEVLKRIAGFILERLGLPTAATKEERGRGRVIFVAVAARELRDARQRLLNDLRSAGVVVVPEIEELPDTAGDWERTIRDALARAELAVHLLGENRGITPDGGSEPILDLQLRLARETAAARPLSRILWAPRWLPGRGLEKRDPFEVTSRFGGLQQGEEIYGEEVTDLSQWLRKRLQPAPSAAVLIVASAAPEDDDLVAELANLLQRIGWKVKAVFAGEAILAEGKSVGVLVPWGKADRPALDALLAKAPAGARLGCLRLPGGDEAAKRRFFEEGVNLVQIEALPTDGGQARALLERLEIADSG